MVKKELHEVVYIKPQNLTKHFEIQNYLGLGTYINTNITLAILCRDFTNDAFIET